MDLHATLQQIQSESSSSRVQSYRGLISKLVVSESVSGLKTLLNSLLERENVICSRPALTAWAQEVTNLSSEALQEVGQYALERGSVQPQAFEEAEFILREYLFEVLKKEGAFRSAATVLAGLNLDSVNKQYTGAQKADIYVKIAETFLVEDDTVDAEAFVNRASGLMDTVTDYWVQVRYRVTYAKILDANRKFLEASMRYYELSQAQRKEIAQAELLQLLERAVTCAILGKAGPQRSRVLGALHKDERIDNLGPSYARVLKRMYMEQLISSQDLQGFEECLQEHQKMKLADGMTILRKAVIEHNMVAVSRLYENIHFEQLGKLLDIDAIRAEKVAARMIGEGRLKGTIDQVAGFLQFDCEGDALQLWDERIQAACKSINSIVESLPQELLAE